MAVKICKHSSLSAFCKALPVPVSYAWPEIFFFHAIHEGKTQVRWFLLGEDCPGSSLHQKSGIMGRVMGSPAQGKPGRVGSSWRKQALSCALERQPGTAWSTVSGPGFAACQGISYPIISRDIARLKGVRRAS